MWALWLVTGGAAVLFVATLAALRTDFRAASRAWKLLAASGILLAILGLGFAVRFWQPTSGPYLANVLYPFGPYVNTWAVSFGFTWLAFGLLFFGFAVTTAREASRRRWLALFVAWLLCWLPHLMIGVAFAWAGQNAPSVRIYRDWASDPAGFVVLLASGIGLVSHWVVAILGFVTTGREVWRSEIADANPLDPGLPRS